MAGLNRHGPLRRAALVLCGGLLAGVLSGVLASLPLLTPPVKAQEPPATVQGQPEELRGVWLTANDMPVLRDRGRMQAAVDQLAELGFNRLYPVVWNGGFAYYPSRVSEARQLQDFTFRGLQGQDILAELISAGRNRGLKVIPWFEFGFMAPPESPLARRHRSWLTQTRDGGLTSTSAAGRVVWLNPFRPEVQQLITDLVLELVNDWGADGIQFDDHMSLPREFGYDPFTTALYRKETGRDPPANPEDPAWVKWRADRITAFLDQLARAVRAARPGALISISPNYYDFAYKLQLQDWRAWVRRGIADELLVQIYRPDLESYHPHLSRPEVQEARQRIPTAIAVLSGQRNRPTPLALMAQKLAANRARGLGVAFFYFESLWSLGPEPPAERIAGLAQMLGPRQQKLAAPRARRDSPPPLPPPLP
ncbi:glycoside hydrolase family 10 protein [Cyanobium gracile]|uniref:Glycosyl hydrolase-like 10 domain-containing protein n=1 Tax=Cyanobium gracile (strain ATCC 27147 / PCC 6307) TaxID=292564 RepID=K9P2V6_CYAGP|nr:glycoside hydrolase family 10 protein [Cyanobium gracile]AFY27395.1 hypothetical protein Cyagr_0189 [Cyanobium gracile PCC 6307]